MTKENITLLLCETDKIGGAVDELSCLIEEYPYFHTGHMLYVKSLQFADMEKFEFQLGKSALNVRDRGMLYSFLNDSVVEEYEIQQDTAAIQLPPSVEEIALPPSIEILSPNELIESFLQSDAKIKPADSTYEADLSAGMQEDQNFYTETLADIYAIQGHKNKAIKIYEQLILKYPEKNIYFAAQIKRLKL